MINNSTTINAKNAKGQVPKSTGIYFWMDKQTDIPVYIGIAAGKLGLYGRVVQKHLNPKYLEYRDSKHNKRDSFQLANPFIREDGKKGIDKSSLRISIGRTHLLSPGQTTVDYITDKLYLRFLEIEDIEELKQTEKEMIMKYSPKYNKIQFKG